MGIQVTGLSSGMDIQSMVKQITAGYTTKKDNLWKEQKLVEYKQDAWKELNAKVYNLYKDSLFNAKMASRYKNSTLTSSNERIATATGEVNGVQNLVVNKLATQTFLTGGKISANPIGVNRTITVQLDGEEKQVNLTQDMTGTEVAKKLSEVGLEANFDKMNGRIFLSSKKSGDLSDFEILGDKGVLSAIGLGATAVKRQGHDAEVSYNGVNYKFDSNNFKINNLSFTIKDIGEVNFTKDANNDIFEKVKSFITDYNALVKEMDTKLNATNYKIKPMTSEEKDAVTETEAKEWDTKIKESVLRNDSDLSSLVSIFKNSLNSSIDIDGKKYSLSYLGISTGNYFTTSKNDRGVLEIDEDKLKESIKNDPDKVIKIVSSLAENLYDNLTTKSKSTQLKSSYTFYSDKQITKNYNEYDKKISAMEEKIQKMEDRYYKQFTAMEKAMATLQSQQSYLSGLFNF